MLAWTEDRSRSSEEGQGSSWWTGIQDRCPAVVGDDRTMREARPASHRPSEAGGLQGLSSPSKGRIELGQGDSVNDSHPCEVPTHSLDRSLSIFFKFLLFLR